jgi:hypothetical protein
MIEDSIKNMARKGGSRKASLASSLGRLFQV